MYVLNNERITKARAEELIYDLAMFPINEEDLTLSIEEREQKYADELKANGKLKLAETLLLTFAE